MGFFAILHTWDQRLNLHPHIHWVIPGGGLTPDKLKWIPSAKNFFVPVRKLSKVFRGKFLSCLEKMYTSGEFVFKGNISTLKIYENFKALLKKSCRSDWVVYSKPPFKGPHWALRYLARYTLTGSLFLIPELPALKTVRLHSYGVTESMVM